VWKEAHVPKTSSIRSSVLIKLRLVTDRQTDRHTHTGPQLPALAQHRAGNKRQSRHLVDRFVDEDVSNESDESTRSGSVSVLLQQLKLAATPTSAATSRGSHD